MSEHVLKALIELFAIFTAITRINHEEQKERVKKFLQKQLNNELLIEYLEYYDEAFKNYQNIVKNYIKIFKDIPPNEFHGEEILPPQIPVKLLKIVSNFINKECNRQQKIIILIQLLEFLEPISKKITDIEKEILDVIAESSNISIYEKEIIEEFVLKDLNEKIDIPNILIINDVENPIPEYKNSIHKYYKHLYGEIRILNIPSAKMYFFKYTGRYDLSLNGQLVEKNKIYQLYPGSSIRGYIEGPIYYSDIVKIFNQDKITDKIVFEANNISYIFKNKKIGLHEMSFTEESGHLVGIMGASGAGKTTLLNILNGILKPTTGEVLINKINIHNEKEKIKGIIGYVAQEDLLIEELTVFQNLYYNAKLCFADLKDEEIVEKVNNILLSLGLYEIKDIEVGNIFNKKISGGQRKRLNIALELIREPAVLFLDEPTSGLSSKDSENIMDLLKDLSLKGKLVITVIHQPSSEIFKMFDRLLILDNGGYLIYDGDPVEAIMYFKSKAHYANWSESECPTCGNVNPEQIFNIVEAALVDEYGQETQNRKISPQEWYDYFKQHKKSNNNNKTNNIEPEVNKKIPDISFKIPGKFKQFIIYTIRDILTKLSNTQYLIITFLEAPILAFILSYIIKFYDVNISNIYGYYLEENSNLPVYIFMSVIVAVFIGLVVSAEEIIKDRKILKREAFLNLSWNSYLMSKIAILAIISAIQSATFVIIGNSILKIREMFFEYWIVLFAIWITSNIMGLIISDTFKTIVTIYIVIPILVIPQIVLSGVLVKYEKLNPDISSPKNIPFYGELMIAKWGYEALAVNQFKNNRYMQIIYPYKKIMNIAEYKKNYWIKNLENKIDYIERHKNSNSTFIKNQINYNFKVILNELQKEFNSQICQKLIKKNILNISYFKNIKKESINAQNEILLKELKNALAKLNKIYINIYNNANQELDKILNNLQNTPEKRENFLAIKRNYHNQKLADFVENRDEINRIIEYKGELIQKYGPIYMDPEYKFIRAHFYAPRKQIFGKYYETLWINTLIIFIHAIILYILLYLRVFKKFLDCMELVFQKKEK